MTRTHQKTIQKILEDDLENLKRLFNLGYELKVVWLPGGSSNLSGEVKHGKILIYEEKLEKAKETLLHEFLDYMLSKIIEPYRDLLNQFIRLINDQTYRKKEQVVEALRKIIETQIYLKNSNLSS